MGEAGATRGTLRATHIQDKWGNCCHLDFKAPAVTITVNSGDDWIDEITAAGTNAHVYFEAGTYRVASFSADTLGPLVEAGQYVSGERGADGERLVTILGSVLLNGTWTNNGDGTWSHTTGGVSFPQSIDGAVAGKESDGWLAANGQAGEPHLVYSDGVAGFPVDSQANCTGTVPFTISTGDLARTYDFRFFIDRTNKKVTVDTDPATLGTLEVAWVNEFARRATASTPDGFTVEGLRLGRFASNYQEGILGSDKSPPNWRVIDCEIFSCSTWGFRPGTDSYTIGSWYHHNGVGGVSPRDDGAGLIFCLGEDNGALYGLEGKWEGGFVKIGGALVTVSGSTFILACAAARNAGTGFWNDVDVNGCRVYGNWATRNQMGIHIEISDTAEVVNNTVAYNGSGYPSAVGRRMNLAIVESNDCTVRGNVVVAEDLADGLLIISDDRGVDYSCADNVIDANTIYLLDGYTPADTADRQGMYKGSGGTDVWTQTWTDNVWHVPSSSESYWSYGSGGAQTRSTWANWQAAGFDTGGSRDTSNNDPAYADVPTWIMSVRCDGTIRPPGFLDPETIAEIQTHPDIASTQNQW